jgi:hypothetical protein
VGCGLTRVVLALVVVALQQSVAHGGVSVAPGNSLTVSLVYDPLWSDGAPAAVTLAIDTDAGEQVVPLSATTRTPTRAQDVRIVPGR